MSDLKERLLSKCVEVSGPLDTPCLEFMGARSSHGYGQIRVNGRAGHTLLAHRVSYELFVGLIPNGMQVLHRCDRPSCIQPDHLWLGTQEDNMHDCMVKGRHRHGNMKGEMHGHAILSEREAREILYLALEGQLSHREIAEMYFVSRGAVRGIKHRRNWRHIQPIAPPPPPPCEPFPRRSF
jgi:hypothetical protein